MMIKCQHSNKFVIGKKGGYDLLVFVDEHYLKNTLLCFILRFPSIFLFLNITGFNGFSQQFVISELNLIKREEFTLLVLKQRKELKQMH
uniref:Uncharacterized protein n=1 Tax=Onchocerca volvulus TaxID=6282 RepID=A0A8R1TZX4_ONCVO